MSPETVTPMVALAAAVVQVIADRSHVGSRGAGATGDRRSSAPDSSAELATVTA